MRRIVILGCGFGGLAAARRLADEFAPRRGVELTVVADRSHFLFTPLWASVVGGTSQLRQIQIPLRALLDHPVRIAVDRATTIDLESREVVGVQGRYPFDFLIVAVGAETDWRGHPEWVSDAISCRTGRDAVEAFEAVGNAFRRAERLADREEIRRALTFVVGGAGPTGVELVGQLADRIRQDIAPMLDTRLANEVRVALVEPQGEVLPDFAPQIRGGARRLLDDAQVDLRTNDGVVARARGRVELASGDAFATDNFFWCGGVRPPCWLAGAGFEVDDRGRVLVHRNLQAVGHHGIYVVGDCAGAGDEVPMKAEVAHEQADIASCNLVADLAGRSRKSWHYDGPADAIAFGRTGGAVMWGQSLVEGRAAQALRATTYSRLAPGALRKMVLMRDLFSGAVARRTSPAGRLLE